MKNKPALYFIPLVGLLPLMLYLLFSFLPVNFSTKLEKRITCSDGSTYEVMITGNLPLDCDLSVTEVGEEKYLGSIDVNGRITYMKFLDIKIIKDGEEIEPEEEMEVGIRLLDREAMPGEVGRIYHFVPTVTLLPDEVPLGNAPMALMNTSMVAPMTNPSEGWMGEEDPQEMVMAVEMVSFQPKSWIIGAIKT